MIALVAIIIILLIKFFVDQIRKPTNYPPGPTWLPIVGNFPLLKKLSKSLGGQHLALSHLAKKYNTKVLGLKLGPDYVIAVFSYDTIRTVLTGEEYDGRPDNFFMRLRSMGTKKGITGTDGELWKVQRNFVTTHLRSLGFGKKSMDLMVQDEVNAVINKLKSDSVDVKIGLVLAPAVLNILWTLTAGVNISSQDKKLFQLLELLDLRGKAFDMSGGTLSLFPWLRYVAPNKTGYNLVMNLNRKLRALFIETINDHYNQWTPDREDDLIYSFITEMKKSGDDRNTFTEDQLIMVCLDLFIAGSQTTSTTLEFAFLMMILHPDVQAKVQKQLDEMFDPNTSIQYSDKKKVPYVEAVLIEVQRYRHVVPIGGPRRVLKDTTLEGYNIPKNATVLISLYSIHNDEKYWKDPYVFRPERFLDNNGNLLPLERLIPFGLGHRRCLGEALAKNCVFTFFVEIIRKFNVSSCGEKPSDIPLPGISLSPKKYKATFEERNFRK